MAALMDWFEDHPIITLLLIAAAIAFAIWAAWLFTIVTLAVFSNTPPDVPGAGGTVAAYLGLFAITTTIAGFIAGAKAMWQWRVDKHQSKRGTT